MKLDEFLKQPRQVPLLAVIEPVDTTAQRIRITPLRSGGGCACDGSIVVGRDDIDDVEPTLRTIICCGAVHRVVHVTLRAEATVSAQEVLASMLVGAPRAAARDGDGPDPLFDTEPWSEEKKCREEAIRFFKNCRNACRHSRDPDACRERCVTRLERELSSCG